MKIFSVENAKSEKAIKYGYLNAIHYLAPYDLAGVGNLCPHSTPECRALCLGVTSGHAAIGTRVIEARKRRARSFMFARAVYLASMVREIEALKRKAAKLGLKLCVRLDGSSDIAWEGIGPVYRDGIKCANMMAAFPELPFVDYTKSPKRMFKGLPANYHLTFSRSETNDVECSRMLASGHNVAVVFRGGLPSHWLSARVIDGDQHDLRHLDPRGVVVGLTPKGRVAKQPHWKFVVDGAVA